MTTSIKRGVLFVCLGNICRSPIAEAVFQHLITKRNLTEKWFCDSAATASYHVGCRPDDRAIIVLSNHGISTGHRARQLTEKDFEEFQFIFGMDNSNVRNIKEMLPKDLKNPPHIGLLGEFDPNKELIIEDPYYEKDLAGFNKNFEQCMRCCKSFLDQMTK